MNQTWLGIDPGLAIVGWTFLEEIQAQDAKLGSSMNLSWRTVIKNGKEYQ